MTEGTIYSTLRHWYVDYGKILRIENTVSEGTVDVIMFYKGRALMMELKVIREHKIKVRRFQLSTAVEYTKYAVPQSQYHFACAGDGAVGIGLYTVEDISHAPYTVLSNKDLQFSLKGIKPKYVLKSKSELRTWLNQFD